MRLPRPPAIPLIRIACIGLTTTLFVIVALIAWALFAGSSVRGPRHPPIAFDSAIWKAWDDTHQDDRRWLRQQMLDDLLRNDRLVGMSEPNVRDLLGEGQRLDWESTNTWTWTYFLGSDMMPDGYYLVFLEVEFDAQNVVRSTRVFRD
ncbi:MAG: hypothetical protein AAGD00_00305 [Planctomycetota bacterium]